ncbi:MAG: hypothetical protein C4581_00965, partial [Nitrospiraceae bacterium]
MVIMIFCPVFNGIHFALSKIRSVTIFTHLKHISLREVKMYNRRYFLLLLFSVVLLVFSPFTYGQTCTDSDGDGYYREGGACGAVDCDDNDAKV